MKSIRLKLRNLNVMHVLAYVIVLLFVFQVYLQEKINLFQYFDEFIAAISFLYILYYFMRGKVVNREMILIMTFFLLFMACNLAGTIIYNKQDIKAVLTDVILNAKFFLTMMGAYFFFRMHKDYFMMKRGAHYVLKWTIIALFALCLMEIVFFPSDHSNVKFGIHSAVLFFGHETFLAAAVILLLCLYLLTISRFDFTVLLCVMTLVLTQKLKAILMALIIVLYFVVKDCKLQKQLLIAAPLLLAIAVLISADKIHYYFFRDLETARKSLLEYSFVNANRFLPFGSGFGTFASAPSGKYYSDLYFEYGINDVHGMTPTYYSYISDCFWPMILGQSGYLGCAFYIIFLVLVFGKMMKLNYRREACFFALIYLLVTSLAESAFVNVYSVSLGVVIGLTFAYNDNRKYENKKLTLETTSNPS